MVISSNLGYLGSYFPEEKVHYINSANGTPRSTKIGNCVKKDLIVVEISKISGKESKNINMGKFNPTSQSRFSILTTNTMERKTA